MKKDDVKKQLQNAVKQNFEKYFYCFPLDEKHEPTIMAETNLEEIAIAYFDERSDIEKERDEEFKITKVDYIDWVKEEFRIYCLLNQR